MAVYEFAVPAALNGDGLEEQLGAAGIPGDVWVDGTALFVSSGGTESQVAAVVAGHDGSAPADTRNRDAVRSLVVTALSALQAIIDTPQATFSNVAQAQAQVRQLQAQVKDEARILRHLIRLAVGRFDSAD